MLTKLMMYQGTGTTMDQWAMAIEKQKLIM